jgi:hypothetical protein
VQSLEIGDHVLTIVAVWNVGEHLGAVKAFRPTIPAREGPILFAPASVAWQAAQRLKTFSPAATSPAATAREEVRTRAAKVND